MAGQRSPLPLPPKRNRIVYRSAGNIERILALGSFRQFQGFYPTADTSQLRSKRDLIRQWLPAGLSMLRLMLDTTNRGNPGFLVRQDEITGMISSPGPSIRVAEK